MIIVFFIAYKVYSSMKKLEIPQYRPNLMIFYDSAAVRSPISYHLLSNKAEVIIPQQR